MCSCWCVGLFVRLVACLFACIVYVFELFICFVCLCLWFVLSDVRLFVYLSVCLLALFVCSICVVCLFAVWSICLLFGFDRLRCLFVLWFVRLFVRLQCLFVWPFVRTFASRACMICVALL